MELAAQPEHEPGDSRSSSAKNGDCWVADDELWQPAQYSVTSGYTVAAKPAESAGKFRLWPTSLFGGATSWIVLVPPLAVPAIQFSTQVCSVVVQAWIAALLPPSQQLWPLAIFWTISELPGSVRLMSWSASAQARLTSSLRAKRGSWVAPWHPAQRATPPLRTLVQRAFMKVWISAVAGGGPV
jgi:hypothetical protein